jgi:hypothetical protein
MNSPSFFSHHYVKELDAAVLVARSKDGSAHAVKTEQEAHEATVAALDELFG